MPGLVPGIHNFFDERTLILTGIGTHHPREGMVRSKATPSLREGTS